MTGRDGAGPKLRDGHARLILERRAERALELLRQFLSREHRRRLKRIELAARFGADRRDFLKMKIGIDEDVDRRAAVGAARSLRCVATSSPVVRTDT